MAERYRIRLKDSSYSNYFLTWEELKNKIKEHFKDYSEEVIDWLLNRNSLLNPLKTVLEEHPETVFSRWYFGEITYYICSKKAFSRLFNYKVNPPFHRVSHYINNLDKNLFKHLTSLHNLDKENRQRLKEIIAEFLESLPKPIRIYWSEDVLDNENYGNKQLKDYFNSLGIRVLDLDDYEKLKSRKE